MTGWIVAIILYMLGMLIANGLVEAVAEKLKPAKHRQASKVIVVLLWPLIAFSLVFM